MSYARHIDYEDKMGSEFIFRVSATVGNDIQTLQISWVKFVRVQVSVDGEQVGAVSSHKLIWSIRSLIPCSLASENKTCVGLCRVATHLRVLL